MQTQIYRLTPLSAAAREGYGNRLGEVHVRASSANDARFVAAEAQRRYCKAGAGAATGERQRFASVFLDERLYRVAKAERSVHAPEGPRTALCGDITAQVMKSRALDR